MLTTSDTGPESLIPTETITTVQYLTTDSGQVITTDSGQPIVVGVMISSQPLLTEVTMITALVGLPYGYREIPQVGPGDAV